MPLYKVFISYHHKNDQYYKDELLRVNRDYPMFIDMSVDTGDISDDLEDPTIRTLIRDSYLRESTITILLVGAETKRRKHIDWEIYSSMIDGAVNKKSGILVVNLPSTGCTFYTTTHVGEKETLYPENSSWMTITGREEYETRYPYLPDRIIDNLLEPETTISVVNWDKIAEDINHLVFLIEATHNDKSTCKYNMSRPMRRRDS